MKAAISKEQSAELRKFMEKLRVPKETIDVLLSSRNASNTFKAYRLKKQISTTDGWVIHFGARWARTLEKDTSASETDSEEIIDPAPITSREIKMPPAFANVPKHSSNTDEEDNKPEKTDIKKLGEQLLSKTFMGLADKLKRMQVEDVDKPLMQKIAFEIELAQFKKLKALAAEQDKTVGQLIRLAIKSFLEQNGKS